MAARAKKTTAERQAEALERAADAIREDSIIVDESEDDALEAEADALESLRALDDGEGNVTFYLRAISGPIERQGVIDRLSASEIPDAVWMIREKYGPGKYRIYATRGGRFIPKSNRVINISSLAPRPAVLPSAQGASPQPTDLQGYLRTLEEREERRRQEGREDRKTIITALLAALPAILPLFKPTSMLEQAQALAALKGITESKDPEKMLELLMRGLEIGKDMSGGSGADSWPALIATGLKEGSKLIEAARGSPAPAPAPVMLPQPVRMPVPAPASLLADQPMNALDIAKQTILPKLARDLQDFAENAADPGIAADALIAKVPSVMLAAVEPAQRLEWLNHPRWWEETVNFHPALSPYREYCDQVRMVLLEIVSGKEPPEEAAG